MKRLICLLSIAVLTVSVEVTAQIKHVTLSGKITNKKSDSLEVYSRKFSKKISVNADGVFSDTFKIEKGYYKLSDGNKQTAVYLDSGFNLNVTMDTKEFEETVSYSGRGSVMNNYLAKKALLIKVIFEDTSLWSLGKVEFDQKTTQIEESFKLLLKKIKKGDPAFVAQQISDKDYFIKELYSSYEEKKYIKEFLAMGKVSPKFVNYENFSGGVYSLDDLKGKYVYIDVWATWCGPCKAQIPFLKTIEKEYHGKNIEFVSISVDSAKDHEAWKTMVKEKELSGIQLFADKNFDSNFVKEYKINGIPRFILIDPNGNIVTANAPRPSSDSVRKLFDRLKL
jgi:thiol-disulfide isomerase/thioredoxin